MSFPSSLNSLSQIPGFGCLNEICSEFNVEITAFGPVVRRLAASLVRDEKKCPDLFSLAPFLSRISLYHNGKPEQTEGIQNAILSQVPYAECFRWSLVSEIAQAPYKSDEALLPFIPVNRFTLATRTEKGIQDPLDGESDLRTGHFRFARNELYHKAARREHYLDCELFHALSYLQAHCEHSDRLSSENITGWQACREVIAEARNDENLTAFQKNPNLGRLLANYTYALRLACQGQQAWRTVFYDSGLTEALRLLKPLLPPDYAPSLFFEDPLEPFISSERVDGGPYRFSEISWNGNSVSDPQNAWKLLREHRPLTFLSTHPIPELTTAQQLVAVTPLLRFHPGRTTSENEHLHVQFEFIPFGHFVYPWEGFGVLIALSGIGSEETRNGSAKPNRLYSCVLPLPSACFVRPFEVGDRVYTWLMQARINFGKILEVFPELLERGGLKEIKSYAVQIFIVAENE